MDELRLGIIGISKGNGHPYSWSAIMNGYNREYMKDCPFCTIPQYLFSKNYPEDFIYGAKVTHIWTQDQKVSKHIAQSCNIEIILTNYEDMIGKVDAILLARDDAENHYSMSKPFIEAGMPVFIDKPIAYNIDDLSKLYNLEQFEGQIFTCSALAYSKEFQISQKDLSKLGKINKIKAYAPNNWKNYIIHVVEPVLKMFPDRKNILSFKKLMLNDSVTAYSIIWESGIDTEFHSMGYNDVDFKVVLIGDDQTKEIILLDRFYAFRQALSEFIGIVKKEKPPQDKQLVYDIIQIIEKGVIDEL